ncbi:MAG: hypothetical protein J3Q66DRAFT_408715 [Benniella sp.]|nr:MAG: hypothetical protein J3Q66DRAFT_408715 [Benniella sp.]
MSLAQTQPELEIVYRILLQASIPISSTARFDQLWTSSYLQQCFQWTDHLNTLLSESGNSMASTGMANQTMQPRNIVQSFLDTLSDNGQSHGVHRPSNSGGARQGLEPSLQELLDPSVALRTRLLRNPGLSNTARVTVLTANGARDSLHQDSLTLISERAMDDLVEAARAHFLQIEKVPLPSGSAGASLSSLSMDAIDRQVKARLIFQRLCDPSNPLTIPETIDNLQEYLKAFRSEAMEVVGYLLDMATSASKEASTREDATDVDWSALVAALSQLV